MAEYLAKFMPVGNAPRGVQYLGYGIAVALDSAGRGEWERCEALLAMMMVALEQALHEGRWDLAWLITFMPDPPFHLMAKHPGSSELRPFGRLTHPVWSAAMTAYAKDAASLHELRRKFTGKNNAGDAKGDQKGGKGGGRGGGDAANP